MKNLLKYALLLGAFCFVGCTENTDDLERDIADLKDRVTALEERAKVLNENIAALQKLKNGATISDVEYDANQYKYTLTLSDGTTLNLAEHIDLELGLQIGINEAGNWQVSYDNGVTFNELIASGMPVSAIATDGKTPLFRVDKDDFWQISMDGGTSYTMVLSENGKPVKATTGIESGFFTEVSQTDEVLHIVLKDGTEVNVPIVSNFYCYLDKDIKGVQLFEQGEEKVFLVHIKGATDYLVTAPQGWKAWLESADLANNTAVCKVIAPTFQTRSLANNSTEVAILATANGFGQIIKIAVAVGEETPIEPEPSALLIPTFEPTTPIELLLNKDPFTLGKTDEGFWFTRVNVNSEELVKKNGSIAFHSEVIDGVDKAVAELDCLIPNSFFKLALGYYNPIANCSVEKLYKLSFLMKGKSGTRFQTTLRNGDNSASFGIYNAGRLPESSLQTFTISPDNDGVWTEVSVIFDLSKKSPKVASIKEDNPLSDSLAEDGRAIDIRFYPQAKNTTFRIADIRLEEFVPAE